jgi:hypothetical protein
MRWPAALLQSIDSWRAEQEGELSRPISRPEAIRALVGLGLLKKIELRRGVLTSSREALAEPLAARVGACAKCWSEWQGFEPATGRKLGLHQLSQLLGCETVPDHHRRLGLAIRAVRQEGERAISIMLGEAVGGGHCARIITPS